MINKRFLNQDVQIADMGSPSILGFHKILDLPMKLEGNSIAQLLDSSLYALDNLLC